MLESYGLYVQMCQFHQKKTIRKYIRKDSILPENRSIKEISDALTHTHRKMFETMVYFWRAANFSWLKERTYFNDGKREYTHKDSRSAINSLYKNLPYLFTFEDYPELNIPNTNNMIEGVHSELKRRLANYRGLKKGQKLSSCEFFSPEEQRCKYPHFCNLLTTTNFTKKCIYLNKTTECTIFCVRFNIHIYLNGPKSKQTVLSKVTS